MVKREGIAPLFHGPGAHTQNIYDGCIGEGIRVTDTRHGNPAPTRDSAAARSASHARRRTIALAHAADRRRPRSGTCSPLPPWETGRGDGRPDRRKTEKLPL